MSRKNSIAVLGFLVAVLPFLGLPYSFKKWGALLFGLAIVGLILWIKWSESAGVLGHSSRKDEETEESDSDAYMENDIEELDSENDLPSYEQEENKRESEGNEQE